jgi:hypothetical protein
MSRRPNSPLNATINYQNSKIERKHTLIIDPNKIRAGEAVVIQVPKLGGLLTKIKLNVSLRAS